MFDWYFKDYFIDNKLLFWISIGLLLIIIILTVFFIYKELKVNKHANK